MTVNRNQESHEATVVAHENYFYNVYKETLFTNKHSCYPQNLSIDAEMLNASIKQRNVLAPQSKHIVEISQEKIKKSRLFHQKRPVVHPN